MHYVQIVLTDDLAQLFREGLSNIAVDPEADPNRAAQLQVAEGFLDNVIANPSAFPVTGAMANSIKARLRKLSGPAQPQSRRNRRKARQERRMRTAKARRQERRELAAAYNEAAARVWADMEEAERVHAERAAQREYLVAEDTLSNAQVAELFELFDLPHVADYIRREHELTPQERLDRAARQED